jgi:hypothetical protein
MNAQTISLTQDIDGQYESALGSGPWGEGIDQHQRINPVQNKLPKHHSMTTLFAALGVFDGTIIVRCMQRHRQ